MLEMAESGDACQGQLQTGCGARPRERSVCYNQMSWKGGVIQVLCHQTGFDLCPVGFYSCFGPEFLHCVPVPPFWNVNIYSVPLCVICFLFLLLHGVSLRRDFGP